MANRAKVWFLPPRIDIAPESIQLGYIIPSPASPEIALNSGDQPSFDDVNVVDTSTSNFVYTREQRSSSSSLMGKFLDVVGIKSEMSSSEECRYEFDELQTITFSPSIEYCYRCVSVPGVQRFLTASRFRKAIYMIVGLKIARGGRVRQRLTLDYRSARSEFTPVLFEDEDSNSGLDVPLTDFVFAYKLRRLHVKSQTRLSKASFSAGASMGIGVGVDVGAHPETSFSFSRTNSNLSAGDITIYDDEAVGVDGVRNVVVEEVDDDNNLDEASSLAVYSTDYTKGAFM